MKASNLVIAVVVLAAVFLGGAYFGGIFDPPPEPAETEATSTSG